MIRLSDTQREALLALPESGMGYQWVKAQAGYEPARWALVFNAELLLFPEELGAVGGNTYERALSEASELALLGLRTTSGQPSFGEASYVAEPSEFPLPPRFTQRPTIAFEGFKRFSAYANDHRFRNNELLAGSYATSARDAELASTGLGAVGRYALPNPWPAIYVYTIVPTSGVNMRVGTVRPAFNQAGGGVEAFVLAASGPGSACGPYRITEI